MHLTDYLLRNAENTPDKTAIVFEGESLSWKELWRKVEAASAELAPVLDNKKQEVVTLLLPNSIEFVVAYLAVLYGGHIAFLLDPAYKALELDAIVDEVPSKILITNEEYKHHIGEHKTPVIMAEQIMAADGRPKKLLRMPSEEQIASLTFTSGTTGKPKAVPNTHANHVWNIETCSKIWAWTPDDSLLISLPLSHMHGIVMGLSGVVYHGNTLYLQRWFDEADTLEALSSGKITFFTHAASAYVRLVQAEDKGYNLSAVRLCISGAAPLPPAVWRQFKDRYGVEILETYGSSETGRIAGNRLSERQLGSPGRPLPGVKVRINKDNELEVKSGGLFPGYYKNHTATRRALADGGFWRTGDIAEIKDGYIYLKGRLQERIRRFGYTVSPRDVEWAVHKHPKVKDIYVMGRQKPGEPNDELIYFIVGDITEKELRAYCKTNLLFAWRPDKIILLAELPRTKSGKLRVAEFKQLAAQGV